MKISIRKDIKITHWIYCLLAIVGVILFVIWTGYYIALLLIPFFIDVYITRMVSWNGWKKTKNKQLRVIYDWIDAIVFALLSLWVINNFFFQNYQIPTSSLEKSLLVGDFLCVSKFSYGGRSPMTPLTMPLTHNVFPVFGGKSYLEKPSIDYERFAGTGEIKRSDIVVFNYPSGDTVAMHHQGDDYYRLINERGRAEIWDNPERHGEVIYRPVDKRDNFVKRCLGLPGERIKLSNDSVFIDGVYIKGSDNEQHRYVVQTDGTQISPRVWDELGITKADQSVIYAENTGEDNMFLEHLTLRREEGNVGIRYIGVNLTKEAVEKMKAKPFIWEVIPHNEYLKRKGQVLNRAYGNLVFPIKGEQASEPGDFPELWLPERGSTIQFDTDVEYKAVAYERAIKNYEGNDFRYADGKVYINGEEADSYTFKYDYYFMMGDNRDNSADSRLWGYVPEDHIVGKPLFVWLSLDPDKDWFGGKIRWNRLFTTGNKK